MLFVALAAGCREDIIREPGPRQQLQPTTSFQAPGNDPWKLVWSDRNSATPALLWNGLIGIRLGSLGNAEDSQSRTLPMFMIWNYKKTGQERIVPTDSPFSISFSANPKAGNEEKVQDWQQTLDMSNGKLETSYTLSSDENDLRIITTTVIDPALSRVGQEWFVTPTRDATLSVKLDFQNRAFGSFVQRGSIVAWGQPTQRAVIHYVSTPSVKEIDNPQLTAQKPLAISIKGGETFTLRSTLTFLGGANAKSAGDGRVRYEDVAKASTRARGGEDQPDIEIEGPIEDQQAVRSFIYYLRSAISPRGGMSISPMGLSNDIYGGHVFWDADMWAFPALAFIDPTVAAAIPQYRIDHLSQAQNNLAEWIKAGRPVPKATLGPIAQTGSAGDAAKFPWESSVTGKETAPGDSRFEDHITGSVAFSLGIASDLGLVNPAAAARAISAASSFYLLRATNSVPAEIRSTMSPDENKIADNDLYTNLVAEWSASRGWPSEPLFKLPKDTVSFLTYDNDPLRSYKQAAAILAIYPLQYPPAEAEAKTMMDRFANKVIPNGPAMSDSINAIIWARIGESDKAYDAWRHGWMDFVRPPFLLFSEKRNQDRTYFTTGAAGELQSVIYGFLGFRIDSKPEAGASWSLKLKGDRWLSINPNLPKAWKRVTFRNFHVLGKTYTLTATHQSAKVTQGD